MDKINYKEGDYLIPFKRAIWPLEKKDYPFWKISKKTFGTWGDTFRLQAYNATVEQWQDTDKLYNFFDLQKSFRLAKPAEVLLYAQE